MFPVDRIVFWEMLRTCREMLSLRSGKDLGLSPLIQMFQMPPKPKSHGLRSGQITKMPAVDTFFCEAIFEDVLNKKGNVRRSSILHKD
ncbi:hypothetical protein AVEN_63469-1 [Araneus ventricosus]|uniref:Uncharacterized protein n=1 Tax=Araneus ventricosus TaxID=182803 RepID=A0A4Y2CRM1_ARAVE|nr:hypothetical protein AVEN_63469-1 [Araneus ventricosus]